MCRNRVLLRSFDYRQTSIHETIEEIGSINMDDVVDTGSADETTVEKFTCRTGAQTPEDGTK